MLAKFAYFTALSTLIFLDNLGETQLIMGPSDDMYPWYHKTPMTWFAAKTWCEHFGMIMGRRFSDRDIDFYRSKYNPETFAGIMWTGGRDSGEPSQFVWEGYDVPEDSFEYDPLPVTDITLDYVPPPRTCLFFYIHSPNGTGFGAQPCSALAGVLCDPIRH